MVPNTPLFPFDVDDLDKGNSGVDDSKENPKPNNEVNLDKEDILISIKILVKILMMKSLVCYNVIDCIMVIIASW